MASGGCCPALCAGSADGGAGAGCGCGHVSARQRSLCRPRSCRALGRAGRCRGLSVHPLFFGQPLRARRAGRAAGPGAVALAVLGGDACVDAPAAAAVLGGVCGAARGDSDRAQHHAVAAAVAVGPVWGYLAGGAARGSARVFSARRWAGGWGTGGCRDHSLFLAAAALGTEPALISGVQCAQSGRACLVVGDCGRAHPPIRLSLQFGSISVGAGAGRAGSGWAAVDPPAVAVVVVLGRVGGCGCAGDHTGQPVALGKCRPLACRPVSLASADRSQPFDGHSGWGAGVAGAAAFCSSVAGQRDRPGCPAGRSPVCGDV